MKPPIRRTVTPPRKKKIQHRSYFFPVDLLQEEDGRWTVDVPSLPGCVTWGHTREEALRYAQEAIEVYLADVIEAGDKLPGSIFVSETPTVSVTV